MIALIAAGGLLFVGTGVCAAIGGVVLVYSSMAKGASTSEANDADEPDDTATTADRTSTPATSATTIRPMGDPATDDPAADEDDEPSAHADGDDPSTANPSVTRKGVRENAPVAAETATPSGTAAPSGTEAPSSAMPPTTGRMKWSCNASGSVRVCGFANVCSYQMVFGNGYGDDRIPASMMAKNACENMARAKGGSTVCVVSCSPR